LEVEEGVLVCEGGHRFPIRDGVPLLRLEDQLEAATHTGAATEIGESFGREWEHFSYEEDTTWTQSVDDRCELFLKEVDLPRDQLRGKLVLDAGCGNGSLSRGLNRFGCEVVAGDVSNSVIAAHRHFAAKGNNRTHFLRADLLNPPFRRDTFDVLFSSGVLHHNPDTREALRSVVRALAPGGRVYIWVYGKVPGVAQRVKQVVRNIVAPMPARLKHALVMAWLPQSMFRQWLRRRMGSQDPGDRLGWHERAVLLLDHYTPRYRWEHTEEEVHGWYRELGFENIKTTEERAWGFGVAATRPAE
jgi:SAM-dependent methyltransferase